MGWNRKMKGIWIPTLMVPFWTHQTRYKERQRRIRVATTAAFCFCRQTRNMFMKLRLEFIWMSKVTRNPRITSKNQKIEVMMKMIPRSSLVTGIKGLLFLQSSSSWKSQQVQERLSNLALKTLNYLPRDLLFPNLVQHLSSSLFQQLSFFSFNYFPYFKRFSSDSLRDFTVTFIQTEVLSFGLQRNCLMKSKGRLKSPNPPKITSRTHPAKEQIAMAQTNILASNSMLLYLITSLIESICSSLVTKIL